MRLCGAPDAFYEPAADKTIKRLVEEIAAEEGPVALEIVSRRIAAHWGLSRLGSTIRDRISRLARQARVAVTREPHGVFLWPAAVRPGEYRSFRAPGVHDGEQRDIDEIPMEEMTAAVLHVLKQQVSLPRGDLIRETALLFGFQRTGGVIQRIVGQAVDQALHAEVIRADEDGRVRLNG